MCGYTCTGCGECLGTGKRGNLVPRGRCPECGAQNSPSAARCSSCGCQLDPFVDRGGIRESFSGAFVDTKGKGV